MRILIFLIILFWITSGAAQTNDSAYPDTLLHINNDELIVTAQRHVSAMQDVPVSVAVVDNKEISLKSNRAVDDILRFIPGVSVTESQVNIRGSSGYGRGVGSRVLFLLDGMPLLSGDNGDIKFDILPMLDIERIEVVKGAGSSLYGSSAIGGVINVLTREAADTFTIAARSIVGYYDQPKYENWRVSELSTRFGSIEAGASGTIANNGILGTVALRRDEGYRLGDDHYKGNLFLKLRSPFSASVILSTSVLYASDNHGGWLYWKNLNSPLLPSDSLGAINGRIHSAKANIQSSLSLLSNEISQTIRANAYFTNFITDPSIAGGLAGPHSSAANYMAEYNLNYDLHPLFLTTGATGTYTDVASDLFTNHHGLSLAYFAQGEYSIDNLILTFGARADAIRYDSTEWLGRISPKIGVSYQLDGDISFRGSFGTGFRSPSISERYINQIFSGFPVKPNPTLQPETSYSTEVGGSFRNIYLYVDGAVFYSRFNKLIEPSFVGASIQFLNITEAELFGHEETIEYYPFADERLTAKIAYTYVYPQNRVTGQVLEFRPRHLLQSSLRTKFGAFSASVDLRYISRYENLDSVLIRTVPDGEARVDAYIVDARVGYNLINFLGIPLTATVEIQNLLNYYYVEIVGNLAPLRQFSLKLETVF